ncbi:Transcriptional repressor TraM [Rhizobium sp. CF080]|uniref:transcriptional repressor TraM n=1 Tax=Rhizobium sp. (strain CF080) TaxID=1144310 RepID=UPI0002715E8B|nr:transcriptional repressor TraM [Rhizobium sp. CF080]EUB98284.1 Transcriptional repressor TraM [Rhizobium sp. CF080]
MSQNKLVLRPLIGLMSNQPPEEVERHVVLEIEKHRRLRDEAVVLESQMGAAAGTEELQQTSRSYVSAMIALHAQQTVVSTLLDILGYLPAMPSKPH